LKVLPISPFPSSNQEEIFTLFEWEYSCPTFYSNSARSELPEDSNTDSSFSVTNSLDLAWDQEAWIFQKSSVDFSESQLGWEALFAICLWCLRWSFSDISGHPLSFSSVFKKYPFLLKPKFHFSVFFLFLFLQCWG
jgi:hypothetical protein